MPNRCLICGLSVQGRRRRDASACAGDCARQLALARTKAWKQKKAFSVKRGVTPGIKADLEEAV